MTGGADHPGARLDDAGLFRGDFLEGMAEEIFVIEIDLRDDGDFGAITMLVESSRPPMPTSTTAISTFSRAKKSKAMAVTHSKNVGWAAKSAGRQQLLDDGVDAGEGGGEVGVGYIAVVIG